MNFKERFIQQRKDFAELMKHYPFTTETLAGEEWRDIEGTDGKYQISNYGRVKSLKYKNARIKKPFLGRNGYLTFHLSLRGKETPTHAHRLVAQAFLPRPGDKLQVNHIDGIKWNSVLTNLEWVTQVENMQHAIYMGLIKRGEQHGRAKLTNKQALYIIRNPDSLTVKQLSEIFGVCKSTISMIQTGVRFKFNCKFIYRKSQRLSNDIREQIRTEYVKGSKEFNSEQLAKKYNVSASTILRIVKEK